MDTYEVVIEGPPKKLVFVLILNLVMGTARAQEKITPCAWRTGKTFSEELNKTDLTDKIKHWMVTCLVTIQCSRFSARTLGWAKEFADLLGTGQACSLYY